MPAINTVTIPQPVETLRSKGFHIRPFGPLTIASRKEAGGFAYNLTVYIDGRIGGFQVRAYNDIDRLTHDELEGLVT